MDDPQNELICWCDQVTRGDIGRAIREQGARSLSDIIRLTGAMTHCNCAVLNPKGT